MAQAAPEDRGGRRLAGDAQRPLEKEYAWEAEAVAANPDAAPVTGTNGAPTEDLEAVVAM